MQKLEIDPELQNVLQKRHRNSEPKLSPRDSMSDDAKSRRNSLPFIFVSSNSNLHSTSSTMHISAGSYSLPSKEVSIMKEEEDLVDKENPKTESKRRKCDDCVGIEHSSDIRGAYGASIQEKTMDLECDNAFQQQTEPEIGFSSPVPEQVQRN